MKSESAPSVTLAARFFLAGAAVGILVGLWEAALLYGSSPRMWFPQCDVRYVIWFLSPLASLVFWGLVGVVAGLAAGLTRRVSSRFPALIAALLAAAAVTYAALAANLLRVRTQNIITAQDWQLAALWLVAFIVCAFLALPIWRVRAASFFDTPGRVRRLARTLLFATGLLVAGICYYVASRASLGNPVEASSGRPRAGPNIVLITLDTVRADHLSTYGYPRPTTPNLDHLALQGVLFEKAIAPSSWTLPSFATMFTGTLPHQHGANAVTRIEPALTTTAEVLKSHGYETVGFNANLFYGLAGWGNAEGFGLYEDDGASLRHNLAVTLLGRAVLLPAYRTTIQYDRFDRRDARAVNRDVLRWFSDRSNRPFFLWVNYFDAHGPYLAPPPYDKRFGKLSSRALKRLRKLRYGRPPEPLSPEEQASLIDGYDNCLAFLDDEIGKLFQVLAASPEWSNTIVIITSDHGEAFGEHGTYDHGWDLYREVLHVPLLVLGPHIPSGLRIPHIVRLEDLFATVLDLALGRRVPLARSSLRRYWMPGFQPEPFDAVAVSQLVPSFPDPAVLSTISLMTAEWHYLQDSRGRAELYRWSEDPEEKHDLARSPEHQATAQKLQEQLMEYVAHSTPVWRGTEYLMPLNGARRAFLQEAAVGRLPVTDLPAPSYRAGAAQLLFTRESSTLPARPVPMDQEMLRGLPYH